MKFRDYINEKYFTGKNIRPYGSGPEVYIEVFVNSGKSEIRKEMGNNVRFIADDKKLKVYFWKADIATHDVVWDDVIRKETNDRRSYPDETLLGGVITGNKLKMDIENEKFNTWFSEHYNIKPLITTDWNWANKWIKGIDSSLDRMRRYYDEYPENRIYK